MSNFFLTWGTTVKPLIAFHVKNTKRLKFRNEAGCDGTPPHYNPSTPETEAVGSPRVRGQPGSYTK